MDIKNFLSGQIKENGFTANSLTTQFTKNLAEQVRDCDVDAFVLIYSNIDLPDKVDITISKPCGCTGNPNGFEVLENGLKPCSFLDATARGLLRASSVAGFGIKKMDALLLGGLGIMLQGIGEKNETETPGLFATPEMLEVGKYMSVNIDPENEAISGTFEEHDISEMIMASPDASAFFGE